jgi:hypothetical protein
MTVEDNQVPIESVPHQQPRRPRRPRRPRPAWRKSAGMLVMAAPLALVALVGLSAVGVYLSRDRTASSPAPQTVTITPSPKTPADGADGAFLAALAGYGISDNGTEAVRQHFMEFGHHTCFSLLPPSPLPLDEIVDNILTAENKEVAAGSTWAPKFTHADAENLTRAAVHTYCPDVAK